MLVCVHNVITCHPVQPDAVLVFLGCLTSPCIESWGEVGVVVVVGVVVLFCFWLVVVVAVFWLLLLLCFVLFLLLFCFVSFYFVLFCFVSFRFVLFCFVLFCWIGGLEEGGGRGTSGLSTVTDRPAKSV